MTAMAVHAVAQRTCAVVLAGGKGSRMGGVDKGLQSFKGQPLAQQALLRLRDQTAGAPGLIGINANRHIDTYTALGVPVWQDATPDYAGPLAGFLAALHVCNALGTQCDYVLTVPCDSPLFPLDLLERLAQALTDTQADIAMVSAPERNDDGTTTLRRQPVFCLVKTSLFSSLQTFVNAGGSKIFAWVQQHHYAEVPFDRTGDTANAFFNANTLAQLHHLEQS
jgi:molybdopterin-guanine dinucleotide biosynthesis protein A